MILLSLWIATSLALGVLWALGGWVLSGRRPSPTRQERPCALARAVLEDVPA